MGKIVRGVWRSHDGRRDGYTLAEWCGVTVDERGRELWTIDEIKHANSEAGRHFFEADTMRFFRSRVCPKVHNGPGGVYFVTSEQFVSMSGHAERRTFSVRRFDPKTGDTHGGIVEFAGDPEETTFQRYASARDAYAAAERLAADPKALPKRRGWNPDKGVRGTPYNAEDAE